MLSSPSKFVMYLLLSDVLDGNRTVDSRRRRILRSCLPVRCSLNVYWLLPLGCYHRRCSHCPNNHSCFSVIRHSKYSILSFDSLCLLTIFNILVNIYCVCLFADIICELLIIAVGCIVFNLCLSFRSFLFFP